MMSRDDGIGDVDVKDALEQLDIKNVHLVGRYNVGFSCPRTDGHSFGDINPSNHMSREWPHPFRCKSCGWTGTLLSLIGTVLDLSPVDATRWLRDRYGGGYVEPRGGSIAAEMVQWESRRAELRRPAQLRQPVEEDCIGPRGIFHLDWRSDHPAAEYMRGRGFSPETLLAIGFGYDSWTERVTIPIRRPDGRLVGFKGRTINSYVERRYDVLGDREDRKRRYDVGYGFDMHDARSSVYGIESASGRVVVNEGEIDRAAVWQAGIESTVAMGTTTMTAEQERILRCHADSAVIFYDTDQAGFAAVYGWYDEKGRWRPGICERLSVFMPVYVVPDHEGDPASMSPNEICDLIDRARSWISIATS